MAEEDSLFNLDIVRDFIISRGGRSTNHELVTHFKFFLNDPKRKVVNRQKFKEIVNTLAIVKLDENGEKVLQLKRKYRDGTSAAAQLVSPGLGKDLPKNRPKAKKAKLAEQFEASMMSEAQTSIREPLDFSSAGLLQSPEQAEPVSEESTEPSLSDMIAGALTDIQQLVPSDDHSSASTASQDHSPAADETEAHHTEAHQMEDHQTEDHQTEDHQTDAHLAEPEEQKAVSNAAPPEYDRRPETPPVPGPDMDPPGAVGGCPDPDVATEGYADSGMEDSSAPEDSVTGSMIDSTDGASMASSEGRGASVVDSGSADSSQAPSELEDSMVSVKQRAQHLNRMESQSDMIGAASGSRRKERHSKAAGAEDSDASSESSVTITLTEVEKKWMVDSAQANYQELAKALNSHPQLSHYKDFITGYTGLHWAAKHGKSEVIKLLCGSKEGVEVNAQTHGGYTPLHLASIQGHEEVIELLVQGYKADPDIRDYSGRRPKQYLKHSASTRSQQILQPRRIRTSVASTTSQTTFRRTGSYSSKIRSVAGAPFGIQGGVAMRSSWTDARERSATPSPSPSPQDSPGQSHKLQYPKDQDAMPPPKGVPMRRHHSRKGERENLSDSETQSGYMPQPYRSGSDTNLVIQTESGV